MNVNPLMMVSTGAVDDVLEVLGGCWRKTKVKLNINSSSLVSFRRKDGGEEGAKSGSYAKSISWRTDP